MHLTPADEVFWEPKKSSWSPLPRIIEDWYSGQRVRLDLHDYPYLFLYVAVKAAGHG